MARALGGCTVSVGQNRGMASLTRTRIAIVSRIFDPEPAAASLRLKAAADALASAGADVVVFTTTPPPAVSAVQPEGYDYDVRRVPALRDRAGYIRGYVQYMSFDIPAFFRILFARRFDVIVVEPPPTTGIFIRLAAWLRRTPYVFYAADVWSEAATVAGAPGAVIRVVKAFERFTYRGATAVLAVSASVARRVRQATPGVRVEIVGNGYDASVFRADGPRVDKGPYLLYAGTASEVHGAGIFIDAMARVVREQPDARLVFVGQGSDWQSLQEAAEQLPPGAVSFLPRVSPEKTAEWIRGAQATLASVRSGGYEAFPTKIYASVGCGVPVVFAGDGEGAAFVSASHAGWHVEEDPDAVATAMLMALRARRNERERGAIAEWARRDHALHAVGAKIVSVVASVVEA